MTIPSTQVAAVISPGRSAQSGVDVINTHPVPTPSDGDLLVKLEYSGVCHSDIHSIRGDTPMLTDVAGHEGIGTVVAGEQRPRPQTSFDVGMSNLICLMYPSRATRR